MSTSINIRLTRSAAETLRREAEKAGLGLEEYVLDLVLQGLDPEERSKEYIEAAEELLEEARGELEKGNVRQAAEKLWGAAALAVKAYAAWREERRLSSHRELWEYRRVLEKELGEWVYGAWMIANGMHTCFYESWCSKEDVEKAFMEIKKLVAEVSKKISQERR